MTPGESLVLGAYFFILVILAIFGWHRFHLVYLYRKHRDEQSEPAARFNELPVVTVQLPVYNEIYVVERLIDAACRLDYPKDRLQIQVLDDSTDETSQRARRAVERYAGEGFDIVHLHRSNRVGFKAGALEEGLRTAKGQFVAVFDADFLPSPDFLQRVIHFFTDPSVGMVQTRWGHLNGDYSLLTKVQAMLLDAHFVLEHGARSRSGRFFNFNGTAGIWRREAIDTSGGWQHDTLTEDLDLSYRAQLAGWRFVFVPAVVSPAELPVEMNGFKSQQHRWAKGSVQTCRKLLPMILQSDVPLGIKIESFFHLSANFNYVLMVALSLLMFPSMVIRYSMGWSEMLIIDVPLFVAATLSVMHFYVVAQRELHRDWAARLKYLPLLMAIGIGLAVNNARAVIEALVDRPSEFTRTPKYGIERGTDQWLGKKYRQSLVVQPIAELALGLYFTAAVLYALAHQIYGTLPFLMLFQFGFLYVGLLSVIQQHAAEQLVLKVEAAK